MSVDDLMTQIEYKVNNVIENYPLYTDKKLLSAITDIGLLTRVARFRATSAVTMYSDLVYASCQLPFPSAIIYVLCCLMMLVLTVPLHFYIQLFLDGNHKIRTMLYLLGSEGIDSVPAIKDYVYSFKLEPMIRTKKKKAAAASNGIMAALEACLDATLLCSSQGIVMDINTSAKDLFQFSSTDIVGKHVSAAFCPEYVTDVENVLSDTLKMNKGFTRECEGLKKNGTKFPAKVAINTAKTENQTFVICSVTDDTITFKQKELLSTEKQKNESLLQSIFPAAIVTRLKRGDTNISESFDSVTCFFSDMVGFTTLSGTMGPSELVQLLNAVVNSFDDLCKINHLEKIKTIGDAYFCVGGLTPGDTDHAANAIRFAIGTLKAVDVVGDGRVSIRIGMFLVLVTNIKGLHTGPIVAGVIGKSKFAYDCWGNTVNIGKLYHYD
jgi:PAS domain S-box-containing protein